MTLPDLQLKKTYYSGFDDLLREFYIPALSVSTTYKRLSGYFSSTILAGAARGLSQFIANGGKMQLILGSQLSEEDADAISSSTSNYSEIISKKILFELDKIEIESLLSKHVQALGWLMANDRLEIRIAITDNHSLFHMKVGILSDSDGKMISFSGSVNETMAGWSANKEEMKVFRSWVPEETDYFSDDLDKFERHWTGQQEGVTVLEASDAIRKKLISFAPDSIDKLHLIEYEAKMHFGPKIKKEEVKFRPYQVDAIKAWHENVGRGIFEMATATGKTKTALGCVKDMMAKNEKLVIVIACPLIHLADQWNAEISEMGLDAKVVNAGGSHTSWRKDVSNSLLDIENGLGKHLIIVAVQATFSTPGFIDRIKIFTHPKFLIVDEVHNIGAGQRRDGLIDGYNYRLGLSATPSRWLDDEGTKVIMDYFSGVVYEFPLIRAINEINPDTGETYLTPYDYLPIFVELQEPELEKYIELTSKIARLSAYRERSDENDKRLERLFNARADVIKNAANKLPVLDELLNKNPQIHHCLIYVSPQQLELVQEMLLKQQIIAHKFTFVELPPERQDLLVKFAEGKYKVLVAMRCLDEGVDVPSTQTAIIMASSGNPREFIQRRGRVLRRYPGKEIAKIYDLFVIPPIHAAQSPEIKSAIRKIFKRELSRYNEFALTARNDADCLKIIHDIETQNNI